MESANRLDDAFRQFMNERGAKRVPLPTVTHLVTGCARVRLVALTLTAVPHPAVSPDRAPAVPIVSARRDVVTALVEVERWYESSARALTRRHARLPAIAPADQDLRPELVAALEEALSDQAPERAIVAIRLVWLLEHLGALGTLQAELARSAPRLTASG